MKFGISPWVWAELIGKEDTRLVDNAAALGFDGVEVAVLARDGFDVAAVDAVLKRTGLTPIISTSLTEERDLIHPNADYNRNGQDFLRYCVDMAVRLGSDRVTGALVSQPGRLWMADAERKKREFELAVNNLKPVAEYADSRGIRLALEVLNRYESSFVNTVDEGLELLAAVDNPACGLLLDTFHMNIEEKAVGAAIRRAGSKLYHLHVIEGDRGIPGSGSVDWAGLADGLREIKYRDWVVIEGFSSKVEWLARAVCMWRPWTPDMDQLAGEGLAFLKATMRARGAN